MTDWTPDRHEAARRACEAATKGPWYPHATDDDMCMNARYVGLRPSLGEHDNGCGMVSDHPCQEPSDQVVAITLLQSPRLADNEQCDENMAFIATARTDLPAALDEIERLNAENDECKRLLRAFVDRLKHDTWCDYYAADSECMCDCNVFHKFIAQAKRAVGGW